jgi:hypothetical protein
MDMIISYLQQINACNDEWEYITTKEISLLEFQAFVGNMIYEEGF